MTAIEAAHGPYAPQSGLLDRSRIIAGAKFNRWLVPPAALAIHLCIGMAYGFSVFWLPLSKAIGRECRDMSLAQALFTTTCDWRISDLGWMFTLFFVVLGISAATWGGWLEREGPRKAGVVAALCWCGGLVISAIGIIQHQLWLMWLGSGVIGGIGLGLGYISPVSTLIKWFPDRRGMATGMAILGFGVLGIASPMLQGIFGGRLIGRPDIPFTALDASQLAAIATIAAGFTGLLSLFNIGGRFFWASLSDFIGRKNTYYAFFVVGIVLYAAASPVAHAGSVALFVLFFSIILSMYGGGFATVPAYLADIFGTQFVGAIHGRLLTAWSTAGIIGPVVVNYIREAEIAAGVQRAYVYDVTLYILAGFLVAGLVCNWAVKPLASKWFMSEAEVAALQTAPVEAAPSQVTAAAAGMDVKVVLAWLAVGVPLAWGVWVTLKSALVLFG